MYVTSPISFGCLLNDINDNFSNMNYEVIGKYAKQTTEFVIDNKKLNLEAILQKCDEYDLISVQASPNLEKNIKSGLLFASAHLGVFAEKIEENRSYHYTIEIRCRRTFMGSWKIYKVTLISDL